MLTADHVVGALEELDLVGTYRNGRLDELVEQANHELRNWGHGDHQVTLERISPYFGDRRLLSWRFWCETCHVSQIALLE